MRDRIGNRLIVSAALIIGLFGAPEARADFAECTNPLSDCTSTSTGCCKTTFPAVSGKNAIIIAMDRCHQTVSNSGTSSPPGSLAPRREIPILSVSKSSTTITVTTTVAHGLSNGNIVKIAGLSTSAMNGSFSVTTGNTCTPNCTTTTFQYTVSGGANITGTVASPAGYVLAENYGNGWCVDAIASDSTRIGGAAADDGMFKAYGLVYRLMQHNIPVYWLINPSKKVPALASSENLSSQSYLASDVDAWVVTSDITDPPASGVNLTDCLTPGCTQPVHRLANDLTTYADSYRKKEFPVRGSAFLIAPAQRSAFDEFWKRTGTYASLASQTKYDWTASGIDLYEIDANAKIVYQNYASGDGTSANKFTTVVGAPVAVKIDYEPPRVACYGCDNALVGNWLAQAGLNDIANAASCASGEFSPSDATYCLIADTDIQQDVLVSGGFGWMWMFGFNDNSPCADSAEKAVFDKIRDYMTSIPAVRNAGNGIYLDASIKTAEGCANKQLMGTQQAANGLNLANSGAGEPYILRYANNMFMQYGDLPTGFASGSLQGWKYYDSSNATAGYQSGLAGGTLRRFATVDTTGSSNTSCLQHDATSVANCDAYTPGATNGDLFDVAAYARLANLTNNGVMFYLTGTNFGPNPSEMRMLLNSLIALPDESGVTGGSTIEVARSSPIVATISGTESIVQGTYERQSPAPSIPKATTASGLSRFTFPYLKGHLRVIPTASFTACNSAGCTTGNGSRTTFASLPNTIVDAANGIPPVTAAGCTNSFDGSCRTVFTNTATGRLPARIMLNTTTVASNSTLGNLVGSNLSTSERQTLVTRLLAGVSDGNGGYVSKLGGIDRSTPAVIQASPIAGSSARPTMIYVGATDGMLHAFCATTGGGCDVVGRELWAFIPRTVIPDLRQSVARVDGSPHVIDGYGDWDNNSATPNTYATVLFFTTGTGSMTSNDKVPALYALDVTTPNNPSILWEYAVTSVSSRSSYEMGVALNISGGTAQISSVNTPLVVVQSNNGGTAGAASVVTVVNAVTGAKIWQVGDLYPTSSGKSARSSSHEGAPASAIPGGAVVVDKNGQGYVTHVVYGTIYGDVFVRAMDATGTNQNGTTSGVANPTFRMSVDYRPIGVPPAIFKEQSGSTQYAVFTTGGYVDSTPTLWNGANESPVPTQRAFAITLGYTGTTPLTETTATAAQMPFIQTLGSAEAGYAQAIVVGNQIFIVTDNTNVNSYDYGSTSAPTGKVYSFNINSSTVTSTGTTMVIAGGAGSLFNGGTSLYSASGQYGEKTTTDATSTTGTSVDPQYATTTSITRSLWIRTE